MTNTQTTEPAQAVSSTDLLGWLPIESAPRDGTEIRLLIRHQNWVLAHAHDNQDDWQQEVIGKWIEHNGGGWTWNGMAGEPVYFKPNAQGELPRPN